MKWSNIARGRANRQKGDSGETYAQMLLQTLGFKYITREVNEWIPIRKTDTSQPDAKSKVVHAYPGRKRECDFRALEPGTARSVMIEVKSRPSGVAYGDLEPHQHEALALHHQAGGLSLIMWIDDNKNYRLFIYPHPEFQKGKPLNKKSSDWIPPWKAR